MGITDEAYAKAIEKIRNLSDKEKKEVLKEVDKQKLRMETGTRGIKTLNEQDLQHEAMKAPLSALIDMWTMRWGGEWVSEAEFREEDFWRLALIRLTGANKVEKHNLANQYDAVYRIIE